MPRFKDDPCGWDTFDTPEVKPTTADWPNKLLGLPEKSLSDKFNDNMIKLERSGKAGNALSYVICAPVVIYNVSANLAMAFKVLPGCGKWYRLHRYEWNIGHKGWWLYCDRCGKAVHDN